MANDLADVKEREWFCTYHKASENRHKASPLLPQCEICAQDTVLGGLCFEMRPALDTGSICMPTIRKLWVHDVCGRCTGRTFACPRVHTAFICLLSCAEGSHEEVPESSESLNRGSWDITRAVDARIDPVIACAVCESTAGKVSRLQVQQLTRIYTITDYCLVAFCAWNPTTRCSSVVFGRSGCSHRRNVGEIDARNTSIRRVRWPLHS
jgi:hypothetical protein